MYFIEKMLHQVWFTEEGQRIMNDPEMAANEKFARETGRDKDGSERWGIHKSVSETPRAIASLYEQNDRFLEFRTPFDERRGLITLAATLGGGVAFIALFSLILFNFKFFIKFGAFLSITNIFCSAR